jgi:pimeloyl-ACP methyl ester carboxylesterase
MIPVYIGGCFGVLHPGRSRRAALICGALADDALNAYRPLVFLAEQLAAAEFPTLRLQYYGTGDSAGEDGEPGRCNQWRASIAAGVAWLGQHCGAEAVTLIGHRVGASLAVRAACELDAVDSLVLLSPVSGRQLIHELTLAGRIAQRVWQTSHKLDDGTWFESSGLRVDHATRDALNALDIRKLTSCPAAHALVLEAAGKPLPAPVVEALQLLGTATTSENCEGLERMQRDSYEAEVPPAAFDRVVRWTQSLAVTTDLATDANAAKRRAAVPHADVVPHNDHEAAAVLQLGALRELPIQFGPTHSLFGILTLPDRPLPGAPALLLLNVSANPRWGNARMAVDIARRLAADGVSTLRMDAAGMGDSAPATGERGRPYSAAVTEDAAYAVAELARRTRQKVVILGMCSGAYHAMQVARGDLPVAGLILVNLQRFVWREGDPSDIVRRTDLRPNSFYIRNLFSVQAWLRLLRAEFDVVRLARVFAARLVRRALAGIDPVLAVLLRGATRIGRVRQAVQALGRRNVPVLYVLGCNDPGIEELAEYFGRDGGRLRRQPHVTFHLLHGADHTLSTHALRAALLQQIRDWYRGRWPVPAAKAETGAAEAPLGPSLLAPGFVTE